MRADSGPLLCVYWEGSCFRKEGIRSRIWCEKKSRPDEAVYLTKWLMQHFLVLLLIYCRIVLTLASYKVVLLYL